MLLIPPKPLAVFPALFWESNNCATAADMDQFLPNHGTTKSKHDKETSVFLTSKTIESKQEGIIL